RAPHRLWLLRLQLPEAFPSSCSRFVGNPDLACKIVMETTIAPAKLNAGKEATDECRRAKYFGEATSFRTVSRTQSGRGRCCTEVDRQADGQRLALCQPARTAGCVRRGRDWAARGRGSRVLCRVPAIRAST